MIFRPPPLSGEHPASRYAGSTGKPGSTGRPAPGRSGAGPGCRDFPPEGDDCDARFLCRAFELGWRQFHCTATGASASWAAASGPTPTKCASTPTAAPATTWPRASTACHLRPRQRPGPTGPDHEAGQARGLRRRGPDLHVRRQGRRRLHHGQRRRPAPHQRRGPTPGGDQRHLPGLPGRVLHGGRPPDGRRLRHRQRYGVR